MSDYPVDLVNKIYNSHIYHDTIITFVFTRDGKIVTRLRNDISGNKVVIDNLVPWLFKGDASEDADIDMEKSVHAVSEFCFNRARKGYEGVLEKALSFDSYESDELYRKKYTKLGTIYDYGDYHSNQGVRQFEIMAGEEGTSFIQVLTEDRECEDGTIAHIAYKFVLIDKRLFLDPADGNEHEILKYNEKGVASYSLDELRSMPIFCSRDLNAIVFPKRGISPTIDYGINGELFNIMSKFESVLRRFYQAKSETVEAAPEVNSGATTRKRQP